MMLELLVPARLALVPRMVQAPSIRVPGIIAIDKR